MSLRRLVGWGSGLAFGLCLWVASPASAQQRFESPRIEGDRLDWCLVWGERCGEPAADRFCAEKGFGPSTRFRKADDVGRTRVLADRRTCDDPRCDGFAFIECSPRVRLTLPPGEISRPRGPARVESRDQRPARVDPVSEQPVLRLAYPPGANLWWYQGDLTLTSVMVAEGESRSLSYDVSRVPRAEGIVWQVSGAPFPPFRGAHASTLDPSGLLVAGRTSSRAGAFAIPFDEIPKSDPSEPEESVLPDWYVRVIPVSGDPPVVIGQPSNVIPVFDEPPPPPSDEELGEIFGLEWFVEPGVRVNLVRFEFVPYRSDSRWPPGCEPYRGRGTQKDPLEWLGDMAMGAVDWASETYAEIKSFVVDGVVTLLPFVPPEVASFALDVALASAGIPPSLPNLDQLMSQGADYLANQMVDELAAQVPAGHALAELGKEELRRQLKDEARTALLENARKARAALEDQAGPYCQTRIYPPHLKITVRNNGDRPYRDVRFQVIPSTDLLRPGMGFTIDEIAPGETLMVPVDIWSWFNLMALPQDPRSQISERTKSNWYRAYWTTPFEFSVQGGHTVRYLSTERGGYRQEEWKVDDGTGIDYTTPERIWGDDPFVGP